MRVLEAPTSGVLGIDAPNHDVRVVARATFLRGQIAEIDFKNSQSDNQIVNNSRSGWATAVPVSVLGSEGSGVHGVMLQAATPGQTAYARVMGVADMRLSGTVTKGAAVTLNGLVAGQRIRGIVLGASVNSLVPVLWDGVRGFGQVVDAGGGGVNLPPIAVITALPASGDIPLIVAFNASASSDPDGAITKYEFDFGEGGGWVDYGLTFNPSHTYTVGGTYFPAVRVTDDGTPGLQDIDHTTVVATDPGGGQGTHNDPGNGGSGTIVATA